MRYTTLLQQPAGQRPLSYTLRYPSESFGRIARCTPVARPVKFAPDGRSANDADMASRGELEATAFRAQAANGFGDAGAAIVTLPVGSSLTFTPGDSPLLYRTAGMRDLIADCSQWVVRAVRTFVAAWNRHRHAHATYRALRGLDERTLRDIGFHRSEISSVAAEISGAVEATRIHALTTPRGL